MKNTTKTIAYSLGNSTYAVLSIKNGYTSVYTVTSRGCNCKGAKYAGHCKHMEVVEASVQSGKVGTLQGFASAIEVLN